MEKLILTKTTREFIFDNVEYRIVNMNCYQTGKFRVMYRTVDRDEPFKWFTTYTGIGKWPVIAEFGEIARLLDFLSVEFGLVVNIDDFF